MESGEEIMANITLYASIIEQGQIEEIIKQAMSHYIIETEEDAVLIKKKSLFKKKTICTIHWKKKENEEDANQFTAGFVGYLMAELKGDEELKQKILYQAVHINTAISFQVDDREIEKLDLMTYIFEITEQFGGMIYLQSGYILDAKGGELVNPDGQIIGTDLELAIVDEETSPVKFVDATVENQGRRAATLAKLKVNHIPFAESMPLLPDSEQVNLKRIEDIARRASAILIVIQFAREILDDTEKANIKTSKRIAEVFLNRYGVKKNLTKAEQQFLEQEHYEKQELINMMWLYEAVWAMYWSIGLIEEMQEPTEICDVDAVLNLLTSYTNIGELMADTKLRNPSELLNTMDENYLYLWACVDQRMKGQEPPAGLDEGVVMERQRAFNWITQLNVEHWDDVTVTT